MAAALSVHAVGDPREDTFSLSKRDQQAILEALDALPSLTTEQMSVWRLLNNTSGDPDARRRR